MLIDQMLGLFLGIILLIPCMHFFSGTRILVYSDFKFVGFIVVV